MAAVFKDRGPCSSLALTFLEFASDPDAVVVKVFRVGWLLLLNSLDALSPFFGFAGLVVEHGGVFEE